MCEGICDEIQIFDIFKFFKIEKDICDYCDDLSEETISKRVELYKLLGLCD